MSSFNIKVGNNWKTANKIYVKVDGEWKLATECYRKVEDSWHSVWPGIPTFPKEPAYYELIEIYRKNTTWTAPEDGYFQIEVFGASGGGGQGNYINAIVWATTYGLVVGGGGGGSGGYARLVVKMNKNDQVQLVCGIPNSDMATSTIATINSTLETYYPIEIQNGANGGNANLESVDINWDNPTEILSQWNSIINGSLKLGGSLGTGGKVVIDPNKENNALYYLDGKDGYQGGLVYSELESSDHVASAKGAGGEAVLEEGNPGGNGAAGYSTSSTNGTIVTVEVPESDKGKPGFFRISRGNTNTPGQGGSSSGGSSSGGDGETTIYWKITRELTNVDVTGDGGITQIKNGGTYRATFTAQNGYTLKSITVTMGGNDITGTGNCSIDSNGDVVISNIIGDIVITAIAEKNEAQKSKIYLFNSTRSDNFLFGKYDYNSSIGDAIDEGTVWPPNLSGDENTNSGQIILSEKRINGGMSDIGNKNASLVLHPNNADGLWANSNGESVHYRENEIFVNNVVYENKNIGAYSIDTNKSGTISTVYFNACRKQSGGTPKIYYMDSAETYATIEVKATNGTTYSMDVAIVPGGYFKFESVSGCGSLIITDIWIEQNN